MTAGVSALAAQLTGIPLVITFHGSDLNNTANVDGIIRDAIGRFLSQISALKASRIICVSRDLVRKLWWKEKYSDIIPIGVDLQLFSPIPMTEAREQLHWNPESKVVLFNSTNPRVKRLDFAREIIAEVPKRIPNLHFEVLTGDTPPDIIPLYLYASDCLLLCSLSEGSPMIVKEALACNLPIVSTDVGDVAERLEGVSPSEIVEDDRDRLAEALVRVLDQNQRSNGREVIRNQASLDIVAKKIIRVYENVLSRQKEKRTNT